MFEDGMEGIGFGIVGLTLIEAGRSVRCASYIYTTELKTHNRITKEVEAR